jgi:hypothetical protein
LHSSCLLVGVCSFAVSGAASGCLAEAASTSWMFAACEWKVGREH